jgi:hypothetical protein
MFIKYLLPLIILSGCGKTSSSRNLIDPVIEDEEVNAGEACSSDYRALPVYKNTKNYLSFENFGSRGIGRCRGHAIVTQKMDMLAKFKKSEPHPCLGLDETTCYRTLYQIVGDVLNGEIKTIGGFDSLYEFSQHPFALKILRSKVASISHRYSASDAILESYDHTSSNLNVYFDVIRRLKIRHRPYVGIQGKHRIGNHAVIAYKMKYNRICVRDPNIVIRENSFENCQNYFYLRDGEVIYHQISQGPDEELLAISLQTDEDERVQKYIEQHYKDCVSKSSTKLRQK